MPPVSTRRRPRAAPTRPESQVPRTPVPAPPAGGLYIRGDRGGPPMRDGLPWVIYGANGVTGRLVLAAALEQGQRPVVAGRDAAGGRALAEREGLESAVVSLDDRPALEALLRRSSRVLHTAGPFTR